MIKKIIFVICFLLLLSSKSFSEFQIKARTAILQDFYSGEILYEKEPDISIYPASMTKIMTAIIAFDFIKSGDLNLNDKFIVSEKAWRLLQFFKWLVTQFKLLMSLTNERKLLI